MDENTYVVIGENADGTVTVRMNIKGDLIDEIFNPGVEKTKEILIREYMDKRITELTNSTKLSAAISKGDVLSVSTEPTIEPIKDEVVTADVLEDVNV